MVLGAVVLVGAVSAAAAPNVRSAGPLLASVSVDFGSVVMRTRPDAVGMGSSTYGLSPLDHTGQRLAERRLDARTVRIPVGYRGGRVTSSAAGAGGTDVAALVSLYRSWGYRVLVVIGGRTNDVDVRPGDATAIIRALGTEGVAYSTPNEPNNAGLTLEQQLALARMIVAEGRALTPGFRLWGPVWTHHDRSTLVTFAAAMGDRLAGVDYHHYGMGERSLTTAQAMAETPRYGAEVAGLRRDLAARGITAPVAVDELNLSWRYQDGTPGGNNRFFTAVSTVWTASALGHILQAGGSGLVYATQNGPLGLTVEPGQVNPDARAAATPMPAYWGMAAWTGAGRFPHFKDAMYAVDGTVGDTEVFAVDNEGGGRNLVLINKSETATVDLTVRLNRLPGGTWTAYRTDPAAPYDAPAAVAAGDYPTGGALTRTLPPMSVTTVVVSPAAVAAPVAVTAATDGSTGSVRWAAPTGPITGYRVSRDGTDLHGGGAWSTEIPADRRSFTFTLLRPGTRYTFTVRALDGGSTSAPVSVSVTTG